MFSSKKKFDWVLAVFGAIAFFVIISVSVILYLLFNKYSVKDYSSNDVSSLQETTLQPVISPEELLSDYKVEVQKQIDFVTNSESDIVSLAKQLENNLLEVRVPTEERENFLSATLQIVRMQKQGLDIDTTASKNKIIEILNSLLL